MARLAETTVVAEDTIDGEAHTLAIGDQSAANSIIYFVARSATSGLSTWPPDSTPPMLDLIYAERTALVTFIDQRFGSDKVVAFLHVLSQAASLPEAIDQIGLRYPSFKLAWQTWLTQFGAPQSTAPSG